MEMGIFCGYKLIGEEMGRRRDGTKPLKKREIKKEGSKTFAQADKVTNLTNLF